jgi:hypothetical protein
MPPQSTVQYTDCPSPVVVTGISRARCGRRVFALCAACCCFCELIWLELFQFVSVYLDVFTVLHVTRMLGLSNMNLRSYLKEK